MDFRRSKEIPGSTIRNLSEYFWIFPGHSSPEANLPVKLHNG